MHPAIGNGRTWGGPAPILGVLSRVSGSRATCLLEPLLAIDPAANPKIPRPTVPLRKSAAAIEVREGATRKKWQPQASKQ